jgi:hypothetical protein
MRKVFVILAVLMAVSITAQTHEMVKHNGEKVLINYIKTDHNLICFSFPNASEEVKISSYAVQTLKEQSTGSIQVISSKMDNLKDVVFLKKNEVIGLKKVAHISVFLGRPKGIAFNDLIALKKKRLREKANQKGAAFVVITSETFDTIQADLYSY